MENDFHSGKTNCFCLGTRPRRSDYLIVIIDLSSLLFHYFSTQICIIIKKIKWKIARKIVYDEENEAAITNQNFIQYDFESINCVIGLQSEKKRRSVKAHIDACIS